MRPSTVSSEPWKTDAPHSRQRQAPRGCEACNASGPRTLLYGATRPHVRALTVVLADGSVRDAKVMRAVDAELDAEALRVVLASRWNAGKLGGKAIPTQLALPITFKLQ